MLSEEHRRVLKTSKEIASITNMMAWTYDIGPNFLTVKCTACHWAIDVNVFKGNTLAACERLLRLVRKSTCNC